MSLRADALTIFHAALAAADPRSAIHRTLHCEGTRLRVHEREYALDPGHRILVIGFGKAGATMAQAVEASLPHLAGGIVLVKYGHRAPLEKIELCEAGHPLLDENSLRGTQKILALLHQATPNDLIVCLISGGGSALLELPAAGISLADYRAATEALLRAGATINELNTVRKHLSQVKGGQLVRHAQGASILSLILSDVIDSPLDTIASGPTVPDTTTFADALGIIERYNLRAQMPASIIRHLERGAQNKIVDTPKADDAIFARVQNVIIADNALACNAAVNQARTLGYHTLLLSTFVQGEAREVAKVFAAIAKEIVTTDRPLARPACVIAGGETTVTVRGTGKGGRNQELALAAALEIAGMNQVVVLSGGTDGTDGPTDAAGAIAEGTTLARATEQGMEARTFLANNDAYHFFQPLGDLVITGPTKTNVNDVIILLVR